MPGQAQASQSVDAVRRRRQVGTGTDGFERCRKSGKLPTLTVNSKGKFNCEISEQQVPLLWLN